MNLGEVLHDLLSTKGKLIFWTLLKLRLAPSLFLSSPQQRSKIAGFDLSTRRHFRDAGHFARRSKLRPTQSNLEVAPLPPRSPFSLALTG